MTACRSALDCEKAGISAKTAASLPDPPGSPASRLLQFNLGIIREHGQTHQTVGARLPANGVGQITPMVTGKTPSRASALLQMDLGKRLEFPANARPVGARLPAKRPAYSLQMPHMRLIRSIRPQAGSSSRLVVWRRQYFPPGCGSAIRPTTALCAQMPCRSRSR